MQVVVSVPSIEELPAGSEWEETVFRKVCGVPLLVRVIATALRNGGTEVLLLYPKSVSPSWLSSRLNHPAVRSSQIEMLGVDKTFDPESPEDWLALDSPGGRLKPAFLWLPWNYVADRKALRRIIQAGASSSKGVRWSGDAGALLA